jgi:vacuolar protein sorting-associated protein VTA1
MLAKQLQNVDEECTEYAIQLMDKLEAAKSENSSNDAITDDVAAKAYVENFALDTFKRAEDAQRSNKVTRQTADTFQAASTFIDVLSIWGPLEQEILSKKQFAKFHALRIAKAIKAGEDPNDSNPVVEEPAADDSIDSELKALEEQQQPHSSDLNAAYRPPTVESAPDSGFPSRPQSTVQGRFAEPPPPSPGPAEVSGPDRFEHVEGPEDNLVDTSAEPREVSPVDRPEVGARQTSIGGGYFPTTPTATDPSVPAYTSTTPAPPSSNNLLDPSDFYSNTATSPTASKPQFPDIHGQSTPQSPPASQPYNPPPTSVSAHTQPTRVQHAPQPVPVVSQAPPVGGYRTDDESTMAAQKHAKWAISALNFEDVNTAVKELKLALQYLGAA